MFNALLLVIRGIPIGSAVLWALLATLAAGLTLVLWVPQYPPPLLRVGVQPWPGNAAAYWAQKHELWPTAAIRTVEFPNDAEVVRAVQSGVLEAACLSLDTALRVQAGGIDLRILAVADYSDGGDAIVVWGPEIQSVADLRGKAVAVETMGLGMHFLAEALAQAKLSLSDITIVDSDLTQQAALVAEGKVAAVVCYSPFLEAHVSTGGRVLFTSAQLPEQVVDMLVIRADTLATMPTEARALCHGWYRAHDQILAGEVTPADLAPLLGLTEAEFAAGWQHLTPVTRTENRQFLLLSEQGLRTKAARISGRLAKFDLLTQPAAPERLFLTAAEGELVRW